MDGGSSFNFVIFNSCFISQLFAPVDEPYHFHAYSFFLFQKRFDLHDGVTLLEVVLQFGAREAL